MELSKIITSPIFMAIDVIIFLFALTMFINVMDTGKDATAITNDNLNNRQTVQMSVTDANMAGYNDGGVIKYDGVISGSQVYMDIINGSEDEITIITDANVVELHNMTIHSTNYLYYLRNVIPSRLISDGCLDVSRTYVRQYNCDATGNIYATTYVAE